MRRPFTALFLLPLFLTGVAASCGDDDGGGGSGAGPTTTSTGTPGTGGDGGQGGASACGGSSECKIHVETRLPLGATNPRIAGEWNGWELETATPLTVTGSGTYTADLELPPGLHAYKVIYDKGGQTHWELDPAQGRRKYVDGIENSAVQVRDCRAPTLAVDTSTPARTAPGQGTYTAKLAYVDGSEGAGPSPEGFEATLEHDGEARALDASEITIDESGNVAIQIAGLDDGKYRVVLHPRTRTGCQGEPLLLVFWIEEEAFSWKDALVYMVLTDRYRDGDTSNNAPVTPLADPRGDWMGGDLIGLTRSIAEGKLDALGIRAIWLTPFQTNPDGAFMAADGVHYVTGYHGYWPISAREVDPRLGGAQALHDLVRTAHAHGIRILQDYVINHVHAEHEYVTSHPEWFREGCICGTDGCDWTEKALECRFADYMPDINFSNSESAAAFIDDALWWLDEFDLDGLRVDAVKHVEEVSTRNLAAAVREKFEPGGTRYFLMGETAMGWNDCADPCNDQNYDTIAKYVGPHGLDGQFDFVLYHGVAYQTFAWGQRGMLHAEYWTEQVLDRWGPDAIMTPYIGSHDTPRFTTYASYRAEGERGIPGNQWSNTAEAPTDDEPYWRTRIGLAWVLNLPGAPLLYYGDEYGQWGGADPNNRLMWRTDDQLDAREAETLAFVRKLGTARKNLLPLRRGDYVSLAATEDTLIFGRRMAPGQAAIVALTSAAGGETLSAPVQGTLGFTPGTVLHDALGGASVTVQANGTIDVAVPARSAKILAP
ncbi:alpha-amylase family glycosyl hydrolase [Chondromyces crocatus]|uniref:Glycosyl hydrolase n=1 Tax=Chondromyces crocatus TaxID=52 RepID=A0A0K1EP94_CHOCO|nr:alpha-amylase family glycosyl hydrolase [Chondromyces crocatus]AKT42735.1 glycosyl hydrolase [Chondromyces crocatus]